MLAEYDTSSFRVDLGTLAAAAVGQVEPTDRRCESPESLCQLRLRMDGPDSEQRLGC